MQGGGWFVPWGVGVQKFAVALPMGGVVPLVPPLLAALPPTAHPHPHPHPPLRLIAPPRLPLPARKVPEPSAGAIPPPLLQLPALLITGRADDEFQLWKLTCKKDNPPPRRYKSRFNCVNRGFLAPRLSVKSF
ncbi:hypothetical protein EVAR_70960_1 [Eumeta japonica]|uniref:Uncharacterized protein n=1 Tax=Eumeta variegata TaxID=151549 RepID=A0A4C1SGV4_EUMVA|nr:hypothetical protein EVAR_70960_1 [Eumeta japonica]